MTNGIRKRSYARITAAPLRVLGHHDRTLVMCTHQCEEHAARFAIARRAEALEIGIRRQARIAGRFIRRN